MWLTGNSLAHEIVHYHQQSRFSHTSFLSFCDRCAVHHMQSSDVHRSQQEPPFPWIHRHQFSSGSGRLHIHTGRTVNTQYHHSTRNLLYTKRMRWMETSLGETKTNCIKSTCLINRFSTVQCVHLISSSYLSLFVITI